VTSRLPAILGGDPAFADGQRLARPATPPLERVVELLRPSYEEGQLTNGRLVKELEARTAEYLGVRRVVAVSSCTAGLMLVLRSLHTHGSVVLPSFTFAASAHAVAWNGLRPIFAECDRTPWGFQMDPQDAAARIEEDTVAIQATHVFGVACDTDAVEAVAAEAGIPAIFDAAHGFGAVHAGRKVGTFGLAEVFSLSPTKLIVSGEGGLVATDDDALADEVALGRDYANPGDYDMRFVGLNARMSELHAAVALGSMEELDAHLARRRELAARYRAALAAVPGVELQLVADGDLPTFKDLTIWIDADRFGLSRDRVRRCLSAEGIDTRAYFAPPVHRHQAYRSLPASELPATDRASAGAVSLPMYRDLTDDALDVVVDALARIQATAAEIGDGDLQTTS
jgi:dTDP-4-amino-4,6-dideoxygalactose transaminase